MLDLYHKFGSSASITGLIFFRVLKSKLMLFAEHNHAKAQKGQRLL